MVVSNSTKTIAIGALVILLSVAGSRWMRRQSSATLRDSEREPRNEQLAADVSATVLGSTPLAKATHATVTRELDPASALERVARFTARQRIRTARATRSSATADSPIRTDDAAGWEEAPIQDSVARDALFYVGSDRAAEEYWLDAINDPDLSAEERQDLIEDLNEHGLSDPRNPTAEELPLLLRRIELIERARPNAMDDANADAFEQVYEDLLNLVEIARGNDRAVN